MKRSWRLGPGVGKTDKAVARARCLHLEMSRTRFVRQAMKIKEETLQFRSGTEANGGKEKDECFRKREK